MAMKEREAISSSGWLAILLGLCTLGAAVYVFAQVRFHQQDPASWTIGGVALSIAGIILLRGNFVVGPNEARVLTFFGKYAGTVKTEGLRWANPFTNKRELSLRARNFETAKITVTTSTAIRSRSAP
jgi:hypothetical protein